MHKPSILRTFFRLKTYVKASDKAGKGQLEFNQPCVMLRVNKAVAVVSKLANSSVEQAVIVIIIVVSVKSE